MFIKLTHNYTGKELVLNVNHIQGFTPSDKGGTDIWASDSTESINVNEPFEFIEAAIIGLGLLYRNHINKTNDTPT